MSFALSRTAARRRVQTWLLCLALFAQALQPVLAHAGTGGQWSFLGELCSTTGGHPAPSDTDGGAFPDTGHAAHDCDTCCVGAAASGAPPATTPAPPRATTVAGPPGRGTDAAFDRLRFWRARLLHAPPART